MRVIVLPVMRKGLRHALLYVLSNIFVLYECMKMRVMRLEQGIHLIEWSVLVCILTHIQVFFSGFCIHVCKYEMNAVVNIKFSFHCVFDLTMNSFLGMLQRIDKSF